MIEPDCCASIWRPAYLTTRKTPVRQRSIMRVQTASSSSVSSPVLRVHERHVDRAVVDGVEAAELLDGGGDHALHARGVADVDGHRKGVQPQAGRCPGPGFLDRPDIQQGAGGRARRGLLDVRGCGQQADGLAEAPN